MRLPVIGKLNNAAWEGLLTACRPCISGEDALLELDLSSAEWSPPSGLVPLAALLNLLRGNGVEVRVVNYPPTNVCSYYCRMDFFDRIGAPAPCVHNRANGNGRFIEISELHDSQLNQAIVQELAWLLELAPEATDVSRASFVDACGELVSNTRHAYDVNVDARVAERPPALIQAQYYPKKSQIEFCICDLGVGIKASLERTDAMGFTSHLEAITAAVARGNRNEGLEGAGLGLAALATYVKQNVGNMAIRSGDALKVLTRYGFTATGSLTTWPGTIVTLKLNVENDADLSAVWRRMAGS